MPHRPLSDADRRILSVLQSHGRITNVDLADRVAMSQSPCLRRVKALEGDGVITGYGAKLDRKALNLGLEAFVQVKIERHTDEDAQAFRDAVARRPEVVGCYAMTGDMDFLLRILAPDLEAFGRFAMHTLLKMPGVRETKSSFVIDTIKDGTDLPLDFAARG